jgi:hypothetical protein
VIDLVAQRLGQFVARAARLRAKTARAAVAIRWNDRLDAAGRHGEDDEGVGQSDSLVNMMHDIQHRRARLRPHIPRKSCILVRVCSSSAADDFIHQQDFCAHRQSTGDRDALAHTPGTLVGALVEGFGEPQPLQRLRRDLIALGEAEAVDRQAERHVLPHAEPREE